MGKAAVVDEEMQFIDREKEPHRLVIDPVGASGCTHHEAKVADSAMQEQIRSEIFDQFDKPFQL